VLTNPIYKEKADTKGTHTYATLYPKQTAKCSIQTSICGNQIKSFLPLLFILVAGVSVEPNATVSTAS
jgi:hypothetical protein